MKIIKSAKEGLFNLFTSKLRSILALLGILVGTASVVAMVSGGELATNEALKQFKVLGTDLLAVSVTDAPEEKQQNTQVHLSLEEALHLKNLDNKFYKYLYFTHFSLFRMQFMLGIRCRSSSRIRHC